MRYPRKGFTLIELLIVVAIIAILAAIAVPNFLEAQVRAKVARVKNDLRALNTGIEAYRVDNNTYPAGTDNPAKYPAPIGAFLGALAPGFYSFQTRDGALTVGKDFAGVTTPIAYMTTIPTDPFAGQASGYLTYCYRQAAARKNGFVLSSAGPDADLLAAGGKGNSNTLNPMSTAVDSKNPSRLADVNERMVIHFYEGDPPSPATVADIPKMHQYLEDLSYDPTNGSVSEGDIVRIGP
jgi:prepilin-type N-terminal cleavage/methylation domain-containing protein